MASTQPSPPAAAVSLAAFWHRVDPDGEAPLPVREAADVTTLVVPGLWNSGPDHWQSLWCAQEPSCRRVELGEWDLPSRDLWVARLDRAIARERTPVLLAAHSLGCLAVAWWAAEASAARLGKVVGALLVAPPDVDAPEAHPLVRTFAPAPRTALPFPSLLIASRDDRYATFGSLADLAADWDAALVDAGRLGHINAASRLGDWPQGRALLRALRERRGIDARALERASGYGVGRAGSGAEA